ncbi:MAG: HAD family hydrolase [Solirubrobacteraceae bacterium]
MIRCLYADLDGTLLGRGASLLHDGDGRPSLLGVRAVEACLRADIELVLMSGRRAAQVAEDARLLGQGCFIFEAGAAVVFEGEEHWLSSLRPGELSVHEQITATGAPELLLSRYAGRLEYHEPWHSGREVSHLFRGNIDASEAEEFLCSRGIDQLRIVDNGVVSRRSSALAELDHVRAYHLLPLGCSKSAAVAWHMRARGYAPAETLAVGDSREDLAVSAQVGSFWLVANAVERDPTLRAQIAGLDNVRVAEHGHGAGVYEAVVTTLAGDQDAA